MMFVSFCQASGYDYLPATTETVACYVGFTLERGTVAPGTIQSYLTPINSVHTIMGWDKPAVGPLIVAVRQGYARAYANLHLGLRVKRVSLPAAVLLRFARLGLTTNDVAFRRRLAGLTMTALTFSRPGGGANLLHKDVALNEDAIHIQIPDYKHGGRADRERILIDVKRRPRPMPDAPFDLVYGHFKAVQLCTGDGDQPFYNKIGDLRALPTEVATVWMREGLHLLGIDAPEGAVYSGHSLRALGATAYRAIGGELDAIAQLMGMKDKATDVVSASYVDSLAQPDDAAREMYDRYLVTRR